MAAIELATDRLLRLRDVQQITTLGSSTIYRMISENRFPAPVRLGPGTVRWRQSSVEAWMDRLPPTTEQNSR